MSFAAATGASPAPTELPPAVKPAPSPLWPFGRVPLLRLFEPAAPPLGPSGPRRVASPTPSPVAPPPGPSRPFGQGSAPLRRRPLQCRLPASSGQAAPPPPRRAPAAPPSPSPSRRAPAAPPSPSPSRRAPAAPPPRSPSGDEPTPPAPAPRAIPRLVRPVPPRFLRHPSRRRRPVGPRTRRRLIGGRVESFRPRWTTRGGEPGAGQPARRRPAPSSRQAPAPRATPIPAGGFQPLGVIFRRPVGGSVMRTDLSHLRVRPVGEAAPVVRTRFAEEVACKKFLSESLTLSQPPRTLCQQALS